MTLESLSHHAYCVVGDATIVDELLLILENKHSIITRGNQDFFNRKYENFTINDARELKSEHEMMPVKEDGKKIFIIHFNNITVEAQNAMLKLLEEPASYAHFFLIIPSPHLLLPTVKSRLQFIDNVKQNDDGQKIEAESFLKMPMSKRLDYIKSLIDNIKDEKKTKQNAVDLINSIELIIYRDRGIIKGKSSIEVIEIARQYLNDSAPSVKMLLEYVALNV